MPRIPKLLKNRVWDIYIGKEQGIGFCLACNINQINSKHFECGHIISIKNGGTNNIDNLRPICDECNKSMGTLNMN
jgi:5-methylcytosine-specific restriction endonuclease McrA